jgi:hypothetical protein
MHFGAPPCPSCGARHGVSPRAGDLHRCDACGALFRSSGSGEPEHALGDLLQRPDLLTTPILGWTIAKPELLRVDKSHGELILNAPSGPNLIDLIRSAGTFADVDLSVSYRLVRGDPAGKGLGFGVGVRWFNKEGVNGYLIECRMNGRLAALRYDKGKSEPLVNYVEHNALKVGVGATNRLRVLADGPLLRIYLNGVLASDLRDDTYRQGALRAFVSPADGGAVDIAISDLQLREPRARWI